VTDLGKLTATPQELKSPQAGAGVPRTPGGAEGRIRVGGQWSRPFPDGFGDEALRAIAAAARGGGIDLWARTVASHIATPDRS